MPKEPIEYQKREQAVLAIQVMQRQAKERQLDQLTPEDIETEIAAVRSSRKRKDRGR